MFKFDKYDFPKIGYIKIPPVNLTAADFESVGLTSKDGNSKFLIELGKQSIDDKIAKGIIRAEDKQKYLTRAQEEFEEIDRLHFTNYILLVWKMIKYCQENDILNSPGRGSCAGSVLLYLIGCTQIDSIKYDLLFSRFISAARTETKEINGEIYISSSALPDIDTDIMVSKRGQVIDWIHQQFPNKVCQIKTIGEFKGKICLKDSYKIITEASEEDAKEIADMIEVKFGKVDSISKTLETNSKFKEWADKNRDTIDVALQLEGLMRNTGMHASGVLLSDDPLGEFIPYELSSDKRLVSGFEMDDAQLFSIKLDCLGLKNLDTLKDALDSTGLKMEDIDISHPSIYNFLNTSTNYAGIFQAQEGLGKQVLVSIRPEKPEDVFLSVAVGRPGAFKSLEHIIQGKNHGNLRKIDPRVEYILKNTYNVIVMQEQMMKLSQTMANFTPRESDGLRKGVGKKIIEKVLEYKEKFIKNALANGYEESFVLETWQTFEDSADYSFNASHATSYGALLLIMAYMKANYPKEFFVACLKNAKNEQKPVDEIRKLAEEMPKFGITLHPPHLILSGIDFQVEPDGIRFGLGNIKGISDSAIAKLNNFKTVHSNKFDLFAAALECKINLSVLSALIMVGSLDSMLTESRSRTFLEACLWRILTKRERVEAMKLGSQYKYDLIALVKDLHKTVTTATGKPFISDSRWATIKGDFDPYYRLYQHNSKHEDFAQYWFEYNLLGFSYSTNLHRIWSKHTSDLVTIYEASTTIDNEPVKFIGQVKEVKSGKSKEKKTPYFKCIVHDHTGEIVTLMFNIAGSGKYAARDNIEDCIEINGRLPAEDDVVICEGKKKVDCIFVSKITIQDAAVFMKISEIKK